MNTSKKDKYVKEVSGTFTVKFLGGKKAVLSSINRFKGFYGFLRTVDNRIKLFKFVSAREYKKDSSKISLSLLVRPNIGFTQMKKWQMVRVYQDCHSGEIQFWQKSSLKFL